MDDDLKHLLNWLTPLILLYLSIFAIIGYFEFQAVKKHFLEMTYSEFFFLGEKMVVNSK